jgi:hypothetical protein
MTSHLTDTEDLPKRLRSSTERMAASASVPMDLWDLHSNACLAAADAIETLTKECADRAAVADQLQGRALAAEAQVSSLTAENERLKGMMEAIGRKARSNGNRTFDDVIRDMGEIDDLCRAALPPETTGEKR